MPLIRTCSWLCGVLFFFAPAVKSFLLLMKQSEMFRIFAYFVAGCMIISASYSFAEENQLAHESVQIGGCFHSDYFSSTRNLDDQHDLFGLALDPHLSLRLGVEASLYGEVRLLYGDAFSSSGTVERQIREGYADVDLDDLRIRVGEQIITWGRADSINPTDNLTPTDYTLLFIDDADLKYGNYAVKADWFHESLTFVNKVKLGMHHQRN